MDSGNSARPTSANYKQTNLGQAWDTRRRQMCPVHRGRFASAVRYFVSNTGLLRSFADLFRVFRRHTAYAMCNAQLTGIYLLVTVVNDVVVTLQQ